MNNNYSDLRKQNDILKNRDCLKFNQMVTQFLDNYNWVPQVRI